MPSTPPLTVKVGQTNLNGSLTITYANSGINNGNPVAVTGTFLTPSCASNIASGTCPSGSEDPGVFAATPLTTASGRVGTACGGTAFTVSVFNATTGELQFTPGFTLTNVVPNNQCIIDFKFDVLKLPIDSEPNFSGLQTDQHARASAVDTVLGTGGSGVGGNFTSFPQLSTTPGPGGTVGAVTLQDAAVLIGASVFPVATGTVSFALFDPDSPTCEGMARFTEARNLTTCSFTMSTGFACATTTGFVPDKAGTWQWVATYGGDTNNIPLASTCASEPVTITPAIPTVESAPEPTTATLGTPLGDQADLAGGFDPTGTITFALYPPADQTCEEAAIFTSSVPVNGNGLYTSASAPGNLITATGTYHWTVTYSGDANNTPAASPCADEAVVVTARPTLSISKTPDGTQYSPGDTIFFTIVVTNNGLGTAVNVRFFPADGLPDPNATLDWSVATQPAQGSCSVGGAPGSQLLNCSFGDMTEGQSLTVVVSSSTQESDPGDCGNPLTLDNLAQVVADNADAVHDKGSQFCQSRPVIGIVKTPDGATYKAGATIHFTMVVSNHGPGTAVNVRFAPADKLPDPNASLDWSVTTQPAQGSCSVSGAAGSQLLNCSFGNMAQGQSLTVVVSSPTSSTDSRDCGTPLILNNLARVVADNADPAQNPGSQSCTTVTPLKPIPTLSDWGMLLFVVLLVGVGALTLSRRRKLPVG